MEERERFEIELKDTLVILKEKIDGSLTYLEKHPQDMEYAAKLWCDTVRDFLNYGIKKSEMGKGENLFRLIKRMFIFGR